MEHKDDQIEQFDEFLHHEKGFHHKKVNFIVAVAVLVLIVIGVGTLVVVKSVVNEYTPVQVTRPENTLIPQIEEVSGQQEELLTYTNTLFGFSFAYPGNRTPYQGVEEVLEELILATAESRSVSVASNEETLFFNGEPDVISFKVFEYSGTFEEYVGDYEANFNSILSTTSTTSLDRTQFNLVLGDGEAMEDHYIFDWNEGVVLVVAMPSQSEFHSMIFESLEEFEMEETVDDFEGWQLYRNEELGFSFEYPPEWDLIGKHEDILVKVYDTTYVSQVGGMEVRAVDSDETLEEVETSLNEYIQGVLETTDDPENVTYSIEYDEVHGVPVLFHRRDFQTRIGDLYEMYIDSGERGILNFISEEEHEALEGIYRSVKLLEQ